MTWAFFDFARSNLDRVCGPRENSIGEPDAGKPHVRFDERMQGIVFTRTTRAEVRPAFDSTKLAKLA